MAILVLHHSDMSPVGRLGVTLRDYGHRLNILNLHRDDPLPPDLDEVDGIISCGGPQAPDDDTQPWMARELELLREASELDMPVVGLCLGCQLLARALDGTVAKMESGIEFGWAEVRLTPIGCEDPLHAGMAWSSHQAAHHRYEVSELPAGARVLASSDRCTVQAWSRGLRTYGFQYHPEVDCDWLARCAQQEPAVMDDSGLTRDVLADQTEQHWAMFERLTQRLFESIALFLMPLDRRYQGMVKDLHH